MKILFLGADFFPCGRTEMTKETLFAIFWARRKQYKYTKTKYETDKTKTIVHENSVKEVRRQIVQNNSNNNDDRSHGSRTKHLCKV